MCPILIIHILLVKEEEISSEVCSNNINHNYNKILESDWFLARPIFYQIGARVAKVSNNKVSNNKVHVLHMRALFIWFLVVTKYSLIFLKPSASRMAFLP